MERAANERIDEERKERMEAEQAVDERIDEVEQTVNERIDEERKERMEAEQAVDERIDEVEQTVNERIDEERKERMKVEQKHARDIEEIKKLLGVRQDMNEDDSAPFYNDDDSAMHYNDDESSPFYNDDEDCAPLYDNAAKAAEPPAETVEPPTQPTKSPSKSPAEPTELFGVPPVEPTKLPGKPTVQTTKSTAQTTELRAKPTVQTTKPTAQTTELRAKPTVHVQTTKPTAQPTELRAKPTVHVQTTKPTAQPTELRAKPNVQTTDRTVEPMELRAKPPAEPTTESNQVEVDSKFRNKDKKTRGAAKKAATEPKAPKKVVTMTINKLFGGSMKKIEIFLDDLKGLSGAAKLEHVPLHGHDSFHCVQVADLDGSYRGVVQLHDYLMVQKEGKKEISVTNPKNVEDYMKTPNSHRYFVIRERVAAAEPPAKPTAQTAEARVNQPKTVADQPKTSEKCANEPKTKTVQPAKKRNSVTTKSHVNQPTAKTVKHVKVSDLPDQPKTDFLGPPAVNNACQLVLKPRVDQPKAEITKPPSSKAAPQLVEKVVEQPTQKTESSVLKVAPQFIEANTVPRADRQTEITERPALVSILKNGQGRRARYSGYNVRWAAKSSFQTKMIDAKDSGVSAVPNTTRRMVSMRMRMDGVPIVTPVEGFESISSEIVTIEASTTHLFALTSELTLHARALDLRGGAPQARLITLPNGDWVKHNSAYKVTHISAYQDKVFVCTRNDNTGEDALYRLLVEDDAIIPVHIPSACLPFHPVVSILAGGKFCVLINEKLEHYVLWYETCMCCRLMEGQAIEDVVCGDEDLLVRTIDEGKARVFWAKITEQLCGLDRLQSLDVPDDVMDLAACGISSLVVGNSGTCAFSASNQQLPRPIISPFPQAFEQVHLGDIYAIGCDSSSSVFVMKDLQSEPVKLDLDHRDKVQDFAHGFGRSQGYLLLERRIQQAES